MNRTAVPSSHRGPGGAGRLFRAVAAAACLAMLVVGGSSALGATPEELLKQAQQLEKNGAAAKSIPVYEQFLKENPGHSQTPEARYRLGKCYDAVGMVDQAVAALVQVTDQPKQQQGPFRNRPDAFYTLAKLYASNKKYDEAIKVFERLLGEGAGLYEDEVLSLTGGYYAILGKFDDAAAKFNLLRRKGDAQASEQAAYKLAMLWLRADNPERALAAVQDLATGFPRNEQIPELLVRAADQFRQKKQFDRTIALCEQVRQRYPRATEAAGAAYLLGVCRRDKGEFAPAAEALDALARSRDPAARALAAEAALAAADVYFRDLKKPDEAMPRYEEAARLARESEGDRRAEILEQCYFRLAEHHYAKQAYAVALDYYTLLRGTGSRVNVLSRILDCQARLNKTSDALSPETVSDADVELLKKRITEKPNTPEAAEAELFLLDRRFADLSKKRGALGVAALGPEYEKLATTYPKEALLSAYAWQMAGTAYATGATREEMARAVGAFEKAIAADPTEANPYRQQALENIALCAERAGDKARANKAYADLLALSRRALEQAKDDKAVEARTLEYLKSLATRADTPDVMDQTIALTKKMIEERGPLSDLSRESRFYLGELYFLKKDYTAAVATFREFVQVYGPKHSADGELADGPWKPAKVDAKVEQVYEAAARVAHAWALQGHDQNMVAAYQWIARNLPAQNKHLAEANYYLALELTKGQAGQTKEGRKKAAETFWTTVVNPALPSLDLDDTRFRKGYYAWLADEDARKYVRHAVMKAGQLFSESDDHETAAAAFREYLSLFAGGAGSAGGPGRPKRNDRNGARGAAERDDLAAIARYALGREYAALKRPAKAVETFRPYLNGHRDDRFRVSGLRLMAFHAAQAGMVPEAVDAYATILDEYGETRVDDRGRAVPVPVRERLRQGQQSWDGIRQPPPRGLDLGEVRFALGFLYWKTEDFARCGKALAPFLDDAALKSSKSRPQALFMAGQSQFKLYDDAAGLPYVRALVKEYPRFEGIEEAYAWAARGMAAAKAWGDLDVLCRAFVAEWPKSDRRSRIDLYAALAAAGQGKTDAARARLVQIARSDTYEDVKADAWYHAGLLAKDPAEALACFESSVAFPREQSLLAAGRAAHQLRQLDKAAQYLGRAAGMKGDPRIVAEAKELYAKVQAELTARERKGK